MAVFPQRPRFMKEVGFVDFILELVSLFGRAGW
jgi:hypothetical protein